MKQAVIVRDDQTKARAVSIINNLKLDPGHEVLIRPYKVNLSAQQRKQYFVWCGVIGEELGNTKDEQHLDLKGQFLVPLFEREHDGYAEMMDSLRRVYLHSKEEALYLRKQIIELTSIMDASVAEMREYMTNVDHWAASMGIRLPVKEDLDKRAWHR